MKAEEITSEQAWEDFKSGYSDFEEKHIGKDRMGDDSTTQDKLDVIASKLDEITTDMARLNDSVPQALGVIEENKTLEDEVESQEEEQALGEEAMMGEGGAVEDDGLGDLFGDGDDDIFAEEGEDVAEASDDEQEATFEESESEATSDAESSDETPDTDDVVIDDSEDAGEEAPEDGDEDFIPLDDIETDDEEVVQETPEEDDEEEEVLEKMVRTLVKMDRRISRLERENAGLKKQLSKFTTVKTETQVVKSRPTPSKLKLVKGSYNRPPVSTQYVSNQRDIGVGMKKEIPSVVNTAKGLDDVFAECKRIADETR